MLILSRLAVFSPVRLSWHTKRHTINEIESEEIQRSNGIETTQANARVEFLKAIKKEAPQVLATLADEVYINFLACPPEPKFFYLLDSQFPSLLGKYTSGQWSDREFNKAFAQLIVDAKPPYSGAILTKYVRRMQNQARPFVSSFVGWARGYNLVDAWFLHEALRTLMIGRGEGARKRNTTGHT